MTQGLGGPSPPRGIEGLNAVPDMSRRVAEEQEDEVYKRIYNLIS